MKLLTELLMFSLMQPSSAVDSASERQKMHLAYCTSTDQTPHLPASKAPVQSVIYSSPLPNAPITIQFHLDGQFRAPRQL